MIELGKLEARNAEFEARNVRIVGISLGSAEVTATAQERYPKLILARDSDRGLLSHFDFFLDERRDAKARLAPTTLYLDEKATIRWLHRPRRVADRLTPDEVLARIDAEAR